jgi:UDP-GlcNAc3NAcA epimerase
VSRALRLRHTEILIHTGQHYDANMSAVFFDELGIPEPDDNLEVGSGSHAVQTGAMLTGLEECFRREKPDWVMVYGDTNSTLAGALAAAKLHLPVAHVEAGLRSFNRRMPEEINRVAADHIARLLFCPSRTAVENLAAEGIREGVELVGDVMYEALSYAREKALRRSDVLDRLRLAEGSYLLATVHRAENTDDPDRLAAIWTTLGALEEPVVFPLHPRTRQKLAELVSTGYVPASPGSIECIDPLGYLDMVRLSGSARLVLTDSGGLQKEAYWLGVPCLTLRDETEWVETVVAGWNRVVGADSSAIAEAVRTFTPPAERLPLYGDGMGSARIVALLESALS